MEACGLTSETTPQVLEGVEGLSTHEQPQVIVQPLMCKGQVIGILAAGGAGGRLPGEQAHGLQQVRLQFGFGHALRLRRRKHQQAHLVGQTAAEAEASQERARDIEEAQLGALIASRPTGKFGAVICAAIAAFTGSFISISSRRSRPLSWSAHHAR